MATVTQTVKATKQPRGVYIKRTDFHVDYIEDDISMYLDENMSPATACGYKLQVSVHII